MQTLDRDRLKSVRKARKVGRPKLAKLAGLTERSRTKLESSGPQLQPVPDETLTRIAAVLQVPVLVLTGDLDLADDDLAPAAKPSCGCCN